jgi:hydroxyacylglutathione hydrolase
MSDVLHVPAFQDNYIWLLRAGPGNGVAVVDPGDAEPVVAALERSGLRAQAILCTHHHHDHIGGVAALVRRYGVPVYGPRAEEIPGVTHPLDGGEHVVIAPLGVSFDVIAIPGHTRGHIAYHSSDLRVLFCGDTMFSAGCGRLFEGTPAQMHDSLARLAALADDARVYCGHEYTMANLRFALTVEPDNREAQEHLRLVQTWRARNRPSLPSTLGLEKRINPFLRTTEPQVRLAAQAFAGQPLGSTVEIFTALRRWKDGFRGQER